MDRTIVYAEEQARDYDYLSGQRDAVIGLGLSTQDLLGSLVPVVSGFAASPTGPTSLVVNLAAGRIYQQAPVDGSAYGSLAPDSDVITQQGDAAAQTLTFTTAGLTSGQSRWALVEVGFSQVDAIPANDPDSGVLLFFNVDNPDQPFIGPNNSGAALNTAREGVAVVKIVYGNVASTGAETPPNAESGFVGVYLIDIAFGQTTISGGQILTAGPSVGTGVPSNYPNAPFLAGLLASHHGGVNGQAPKINLATETQGVLPMANLPVTSTAGKIAAGYSYAGNPNGHVAGVAAVAGTSPADQCEDTTTATLYLCTTTGNAASAVWTAVGGTGSVGTIAWGGTSTGSANAQVVTTTPVLVSLTPGQVIGFSPGFANTAALTLTVSSTGVKNALKRSPAGPVPFTGGELQVANDVFFQWDGAEWQLMDQAAGTMAALNIGVGGQNDGSGNYRPTALTSPIAVNTPVHASSHMTRFIATTGLTLTLDLSSTLFTTWKVSGFAFGGAITITPQGSDQINSGGASVALSIPQGSSFELGTDAAGNFYCLNLVPAASSTETRAGTNTAKFVTPAGVAALKFVSTAQSIPTGGEIGPINHLLAPGAAEQLIGEVVLKCTGAEGGYSTNDCLTISFAGNSAEARGITGCVNLTQISATVGTSSIDLPTKTTGATFSPASGGGFYTNWVAFLRARY